MLKDQCHSIMALTTENGFAPHALQRLVKIRSVLLSTRLISKSADGVAD